MKSLLTNHLDAWGISFGIASTAVILHQAISLQTALLVITIAAGYWLGFAVNDYYDAPYDQHDPHKARRNFFVQHPITPRTFYAITGGILFGFGLVFASFGLKGILCFALTPLVIWAYSAPPLRLKSRPGLDLLTHAFFVQSFPYFVCLFLMGVVWTPLDRVLLAAFFCASLCAQLEQQARDFEVDSLTDANFTTRVGLNTTTVLLKIFTAILCLITVITILGGVFPLFLLPFGLMILPLFLHRLVRPRHIPRSERFVVVGVAIMLVYIGILWITVIFG